MSRLRTVAFAAVLAGCASAEHARAELLSYEPFNYAAGTAVVGQGAGGSSGFLTPWTPGGFNASQSNNFLVGAGSLQHNNLATTGGRLTSGPTNVISGITRDLAVPLGAQSTTRYVSFLVEPNAPLHQGAFNGFFGLTFESAGEPEFYAGKPGGGAIGNYVIENRGGDGQSVSNFLTTPGQTALLVVKAEFTAAGADRMTLYVNPTPGMPEPTSASAFKGDANFGSAHGLTVYSTGSFSLDEIRVGTTYADVTPAVPEPAAVALAASVAATFVRRRRPRIVRA